MLNVIGIGPRLAGDDDHGSRGGPAGGRDRGGLQDLHPPPVKAFTGDKQVIKTGMCKEIERCRGGHRAGAGRAQRCADQQRRRRHLRHGGAGAGAG